MAFLRCSVCNGKYRDVQSDGMAYAHVCPPVTVLTVKRGAATVDVDLHDVKSGDVEVSRRAVERLNARNENFAASQPDTPGGVPKGAAVEPEPAAREVFNELTKEVVTL